jgi:hypothetical protein
MNGKIAPTKSRGEKNMKAISWKVIVSVVSLAALTLACSGLSLPGLGSGDSSLLRDDFSDSNSGWGTGTDADSSVEYVNNGLQSQVFTSNFFTWSTPGDTSYENIHIEAAVKNDSTDPLSMMGVICFEQGKSTSFYYLGVAADGYYTISTSTAGQKDVSLKNGTSSLVPTDNQTFTLGADCGSGKLALYINGQLVDSVQDSTYTSGRVGLFTSSSDQPNGANITFDDFVVTSLPK